MDLRREFKGNAIGGASRFQQKSLWKLEMVLDFQKKNVSNKCKIYHRHKIEEDFVR